MAVLFWKRKMVGMLDKRVFTRAISGNNGMLRTPKAWAIQADTFDKDLRGKCDRIVFLDTDTQKRYVTTFREFDEHKVVLDRGFGKQYYLTLEYFNTPSMLQGTLALKNENIPTV